MSRCKAVVSMFLLAFAASTVPARAETENCTVITTVPVAITASGVYCLKGNVITNINSGPAISVNIGNVTIDLNGFYLTNVDTTNTARGIFFQNQIRNTTIKNGIIGGFYEGIYASSVLWGTLVEDMRIINSRAVGILLSFSPTGGGIIRHNQIAKTGGTVANVDTQGINIFGGNVEVANNLVTETAKAGTGISTGIFSNGSVNHMVIDNRVVVADMGIRLEPSFGLYRDNIVINTLSPYSGGIDINNNYPIPGTN